uniref:Reverse transcriptase Ty1/copia-type domain-containing protein n=1 Tax=Tanacetum cinerariifolium TaxID=118510 RepID=A0A6L2LDB5_TANCI|nr:hypothetical protein [Tanacetum cinerariifolium]
MFALTVSTAEPKNIKEAMADSAWIEVMQEELHQFDKLQVWELIDKPFGKTVIRIKWLWKNKKDEDQTVIHNKARLVAKGTQVFSNLSNGRERTFLNGPLKEEVYVAQPYMFVNPDHPEKVYRLRKALYGLKQAPRAWYDELSKFLTSKGFTEGLQIHQSPRGIFINQAKYALEILHKHEAEYVALSASCAQVMWMRIQLQDYGFNYNKIPLYFLRYDGDECDKGRMPTKIKITLEQSQQGVSNDVLGELKFITTRSGIVLDGPSVPIPPPFINSEEDEHEEETLTDQDLAEYTIKEKLLELANTPLNENYLAVILKKLLEKLRDPGKFLIPCGFSELKCKALADLGASINLMPLSVWKKLGLPKLISSRMTFELANRAICTPTRIIRDVFIPIGNTISSPNHLLEEFIDELALITFPLRNDDLPFDIESDLKEIEYLVNYDPIKDMDSILEDSVDESNLANLNDNLVDTMPEMFTDEHALNYSSPPLYDEYYDDLFEVESDTEYVYDDPFESNGEKIKESKLLIDELDLPRSSDFLPSPEYDLFLYEDFSEVDALPSTNNEDKEKVFKPEILTFKGVHTSLLLEVSHRGPKVFKVIKSLESPMEIFPCSHKEDIRILDVPCLHFYPCE